MSYKLNGVDKKAQEVIGQKGLVEITLKATPRDDVNQYYRNNMLLQVATMVSMDTNLSVESPGAQQQMVGDKKAIIFMGLPGEQCEFVVKIGSDDFEFPGFAIMMIPATLGQLADIKELKETKEKIEDSTEAMNASMDVILNTLDAMQGSLSDTADGLKDLNEARGIVSNKKDGIYESADKGLINIEEGAKQLEKIIPHLEATEQFIGDVNIQVNSIVNTTNSIKPKLTKLQNIMEDLNYDLKRMNNMVWDLAGAKWNISKEDDLKKTAKSVQEDITKYKTVSASIQKDVNTLDSLDKEISRLISVMDEGEEEVTPPPSLEETLGQIGAGMGQLQVGMGAMGSGLKSLEGKLNRYLDVFDIYASDIQDILGNAREFNTTVSEISEIGKKLIDQSVELNSIVDANAPVMQQAANDTKELLVIAVDGLNNANGLLSQVNEVAKSSGQKLDEGTQKSLEGLAAALETSVTGLGQTDTIRNAKNTIKSLIDSEWDKYTKEENHLLNIDTEERPISFTSSENSSPDSIQIILRTAELTKDDIKLKVSEPVVSKTGNIFTRIADIFKNMASMVAGVFS